MRIIIGLFTSVLYMPILDVFAFTISCESDANNNIVHQVFKNEICWSSSHIVHGIIAILGIILFYIICMIMALTYFEGRYQISDALARISGRPMAYFFTYELIMILTYSLLEETSSDYIIIGIMLLGSYIVFYRIHIEHPFFNAVRHWN